MCECRSVWRMFAVVCTTVCVVGGGCRFGGEPLARVVVESGQFERVDTPVSISLAQLPGAATAGGVHLEEIKGSQRIAVPAQVEGGSAGRLWWILSGTTPAKGKRVFEVMAGSGPQVIEVKAVQNDKVLDLSMGDAKILRYNHAIVPAPKDLGKIPEARRSRYDRGGFIHPLWSPKGAVLTDIHPPDHIHHYGIWMPWTHTQFEGKLVDFWNVGDGTGTVRFVKFLSTTSGPVYGGFQAEHNHVALQTSVGEQVILKEVWDVRAYNVGGPGKGYWLVDLVSTQRCMAKEPLIQDEYRYGGFGFRGAREWSGETASYLTSEGKDRENGHATRARWCDTAGAIAGAWAGVTHMSNPQNFRHPEPMRIWPSSENPRVFFGWAPSQLGAWEMKPGEDHVWRYRMYVHEGKVVVADAERVWNDYANPPVVTVVSR